MQSRRTHRKSRNGCKTCKQRRVKCDENGPPCGPCEFRSVACIYANTQREREPTPRQPTPPPSVEPAPSEAPSTVSTEGSSPSTSRRLLELELLHQWSTATYKSYCGTVEAEYHNWQVVVPRLAFKHDYLLQGLLAMSALEIAAFTENNAGSREHYVNAALEYHNLASSSFRAQLMDLTPANHQPMFALSSILMIMGLALPRFTVPTGERIGMLDHILTFFDLVKGFIVVVWTKQDAWRSDPLLENYKEWDELPVQTLEPDLQTALDRLVALNDRVHGADGQAGGSMTALQRMSYHAACRRSIFFLKDGFSKCVEPDYRGYCLAWPFQSGKDYISAVKDKEPIALLILMHWGVLLESLSYTPHVWWADSVGNNLVEDLSHVIGLQADDELTYSVEWARQRVGLDAST